MIRGARISVHPGAQEHESPFKSSADHSEEESIDKKNRLCIYSNESEASKISPEWNSWLRFISVASPKDNRTTHKWQKQFNGNLTGLDSAYKPRIVRTSSSEEDLDSYQTDYKAWKPE